MIQNRKTRQILILSLIVAAVVLATGGPANADFTFGEPVNLGPVVNSDAFEQEPYLSADGLSLYFTAIDRPGGQGAGDIWVTTRSSVDDPWGTPVSLGPSVNSPSGEQAPCISADGLELYFTSYRNGGFGIQDLWVTTRATKADTWGTPVNLGPTVNSSSWEGFSSISSDGLSLYFSSYERPGGSGGWDLWVTARPSLSDPWGTPVNLGTTINSSEGEMWPSISSDGLVLFFDRGPAGGTGPDDIWMTRRATVSDPWGVPVKLGPRINTPADNGCSNISADGRTLYFCSSQSGGYGSGDLWQVSIIPNCDFNGDLKVDIKDLLILIEHWGQNYPLCDMGPMPWGDGRVDERDLEVLMGYWGQELPDPNLVGHWKLDESDGTVAKDSARANDATLKGNPMWQPAGGKVGGAILLDGVDDYVQTPSVLNPSQGPFSLLAWVKGGAPGQVIFSQMVKANWLSTDASTGHLMTELKAQGSLGTTLQSQSVVTDGDWHRVGLTWDGTNRILYVDGVEAARDTQPSLPGSSTGLYMGVGNKLSKGSFWSGLIDDVRIYNRAVKP